MYTGTKEKMVELEKNFLDGLYTPFAPECALSEMDQNVAQPPPKKKRKWHNNSMWRSAVGFVASGSTIDISEQNCFSRCNCEGKQKRQRKCCWEKTKQRSQKRLLKVHRKVTYIAHGPNPYQKCSHYNSKHVVICSQAFIVSTLWSLVITIYYCWFSPRFERAWCEHISMCMFVQVQPCTCTSMLSGNAPHAHASLSRLFKVRWNQQYKWLRGGVVTKRMFACLI